MIIECPSPQSKCIPVSICHPVVNCCCHCPTKCICFTNCCPQTPQMNFKTEICNDQYENNVGYDMSSQIPSTAQSNISRRKIFSNQFRNSTPDIRHFHSKTNSYFNLNKDNTPNDNYINNIQNNLNDNDNNIDANSNLTFRPNLSISKNNSINYTYKKKIDTNRQFIKNKANLHKSNELLNKINCISHRIDKTLSIYKNKNDINKKN